MPTYVVTNPATGQKLKLTGDTPPTDEDLDEIFKSMPAPATKAEDVPVNYPGEQAPISQPNLTNPVDQPRSFLDKAIGAGEAGLALGTGATLGTIASIASSAKNIGQSVLDGTYGTQEGADKVANQAAQTAANFTYSPRTEAGQEYTANLAKAAEPLAAAAPFTQELGIIASGAKSALPAAELAVRNEAALLRPNIAPKKLDLIDRLKSGSTDNDLATLELKVENPKLKDAQGNLLPEAYKVVDDDIAKDAIKQGIRDGSVQAIKSSDPYTAKKMLEMTGISERAKGNDLYAVDNRPSNIIGDEIINDYKYLKNVNKRAGEQIDVEAKSSLKGKQVDVSIPVSEFIAKIEDELGVALKTDETGKVKPDFSRSQIRASTYKKDRQFIKNIVDDLHNSGMPDAYNVHNFKRAIDNMVVYGGESPLNSTVERSVKKLRNGLDDVLDSNFEKYNKANSDYAATVKAIGDFKDVAGKKLNLDQDGASKQVGILTRGILSNIKSGQQLDAALTNLQKTANQYGANSKADLKSLIAYSNELDRRFGSHAATSFGGEIEKSTAKGTADLVASGASAATGSHHGMIRTAANIKDRLFKTTDKDAYQSLRKLIVKTYTKKEKEAQQ
jgi:hypothetical protein